VTQWLQQTNPAAFSVYAISAAFITYFAMYSFRKPFTAGMYEGLSLWGIDYKILAVTTQIVGYTLSKFVGIKLVAELRASTRIKSILVLIGIAWLALFCFALVPPPYNVVFLFLNGLPLGMIWGVVFSFLEGRRFTELLGAGMATSFIVSSGIVKATGRSLVVNHGISEFWMPFLTGMLYLPALFIGVAMLSAIPAPTASDEVTRTRRVPMDGAARLRFFSTFALGIFMTVSIYIALTIFRDVRDNFAVEIWSALGYDDKPHVLATAEIPIAAAVMIIISLMVLIRSNRAAFYLNQFIIIFAGALLLLTTVLFTRFDINPVLWMILNGFSMYLAYIAFHTFLFERWIALFRYESNVGFLMYLADAFGYLGSVSILLVKNFADVSLSWLSLFIKIAYVTAILTMLLGIGSTAYFLHKERHRLAPAEAPPETENPAGTVPRPDRAAPAPTLS
jgi:hypothetical protein